MTSSLSIMKKYAIGILFISVALLSFIDFLTDMQILRGSTSNFAWVLYIVPFLYSSYILCTDFNFESVYFKYSFYLFLGYELIIFLRGILQTSDFLSIIKQGPILWVLMVPFFVFFDKAIYNFRKIFNVLYALAIFFLIVNIIYPFLLVNRATAQGFIPSFAIGCGFLFLNAKYLNNKKVNVAFLILLLCAISYTYLARRSAAFTFYAFIFSGYVFNIFNKSRSNIFKLLPVIIFGAFFFFLIPNPASEALLKKMDERILEDTRTNLFDEFYKDMSGHMMLGKGMNGTYYYPMDETVQEDGIVYSEITYRNIIENGYLQLLLSGGIIHIILFVLILLPASIAGIFFSSNTLSKACGILILLWLIDMFLYGMPTLSIHYVLVWISAGVCFKKSLRNKNDAEIFYELNQPGKKVFYKKSDLKMRSSNNLKSIKSV